MARVFHNIFGNLSGKIGNMSASIRKGNTILSARPLSYKIPDDPDSVKRRSTFLSTVRFARQVYRLTDLHEAWEKTKDPEISIYNHIVKTNYQFASPEKPTIRNIITPGGFELNIQNIAVFRENFLAEIPAFPEHFGQREHHLNINSVVCFYSPLNQSDIYYTVINLITELRDYNWHGLFELRVDFNSDQKAVLSGYTRAILYAAAVTKSCDGSIIQHSTTSVKDVQIQ